MLLSKLTIMKILKSISTMKKVLSFGLLVVFSFSCTNLDETLYSQVTQDNFFKTDEERVTALAAAYTVLYFWGSHNGYYSYQEVTSDEMAIPVKGNDWLDGNQWVFAHRHTMNAQGEGLNNMWNDLFRGVNTCNRLIKQFEAIANSEATVAEVKTLRAFYYYLLMDNFGGVPLVTSFDNAEPNPSRASRTEVYNFVVSELNANVPLLSKEKDASTYARFNFWAGKTLQARVLLNSGVYLGTNLTNATLDAVIAACDEVINSTKFSLEPNFFSNFSPTNGGPGAAEFILAVPYDEKFAGGFNIHQMTLHYESQKTYNLVDQPWNGYTTLQSFYNSFDAADLRRNTIITGPQFSSAGVRLTDTGAEPSDPDGQPLTFTPALNELTPNAFRQAGGRVGKFQFKLGARNTLDNDFPIYRYAEVLMMKAEALWRKNNSDPAALALVNSVRARVFEPDQPLASLGTPGDSYPGPVLLQELGREFFAEAKRRQDLIRFGKFGAAWDFKDASAPTKTIFPIPAPQRVANPNLDQNPGY
jgi:hypothetical protein